MAQPGTPRPARTEPTQSTPAVPALGDATAPVEAHAQIRPPLERPLPVDDAPEAATKRATAAAPPANDITLPGSVEVIATAGRAVLKIEPLLAEAAKPTIHIATAAPRAADPVPTSVAHPGATTTDTGVAPTPASPPNPDPRSATALPLGGVTAASSPADAPAPTVASVPAVEPETAPKDVVAAALASAVAPATTTPRAAPQPLASAPSLDTAGQLVARPASTPRANARIAPVTEPNPPTLTTAGALAATAAAVAPAQPAPVDMTRPAWPTAMIHRIERLRDELNAASTAIRLIPDALGKIDVSLTQADGVTHVHLAAEQPQTRTLLAEAAPELAKLAEQRGLKLGDAQVQGGPGSHANGGGQQPAAQQTPRRPAAASAPSAAERADPTTEDRIA